MRKQNVKQKCRYGKGLKRPLHKAIDRNLMGNSNVTKRTYKKRLKKYLSFLKDMNIKNVLEITMEVYEKFTDLVAHEYSMGLYGINYATNLISAANAAMRAVRLDNKIHIRPSQKLGRRSNVPLTTPTALDNQKIDKVIAILKQRGHHMDALFVKICRLTGMRMNELIVQDFHRAFEEAKATNYFDVREGTKGGAGKYHKRPVFVDAETICMLKQLRNIQGYKRNIIPEEYTSAYDYGRAMYMRFYRIGKSVGLTDGYRSLRKAYACTRYLQITGFPAPVVQRMSGIDRATDERARLAIAISLGHCRTNICINYIGGKRHVNS